MYQLCHIFATKYPLEFTAVIVYVRVDLGHSQASEEMQVSVVLGSSFRAY